MPATQAAGAAGNVAITLQFVMPSAGSNVVVSTSESASNAPIATGTATVSGEVPTTVASAPTGLPTTQQAPGATVNGALTFSDSGASTAYNPVYSGTLPSGLTGVVLGTPTINGVAVTGATASYVSATGAITLAGMPTTQAAGAAGNVAVSLQFVMPASGANLLVTTTESASNAATATGQATVSGEPLTALTAAPAGLPTTPQAPGATVNGALTFDNTGSAIADNPVYSAALPAGLTGVVLGTPTVKRRSGERGGGHLQQRHGCHHGDRHADFTAARKHWQRCHYAAVRDAKQRDQCHRACDRKRQQREHRYWPVERHR